jgi:hypothetical protein
MLATPGVAQQPKKTQGSTDSAYAEAIRFEKAKEAADARQARMEAQHPCGCASPSDVAAAREGKAPSQRASTSKPKK